MIGLMSEITDSLHGKTAELVFNSIIDEAVP